MNPQTYYPVPRLVYFGSQGAGAYPAHIGQEAGNTLDRLPSVTTHKDRHPFTPTSTATL